MTLELRTVIRQVGMLMIVVSALIGAAAIFAVYDHVQGNVTDRSDLIALLLTSFIGTVVGGVLFLLGRASTEALGQREALLLVATSWIIAAVLSAIPYRLWASFRVNAAVVPHSFDSLASCFFEAMSGLTTTGATTVEQLSTLPRSILLWRALTHWIGGLGIVVLFVAVLPLLGVGGRRIYRLESPGPSPDGVTPRIQDTARSLWLIYVGLTLAEVLALKICGMGWFDSVCHTFATLATGGFGTKDASVAAFDSSAIHYVIIVFMVLAGVNFGLYHQLMQRRWRKVRKDPELRAYLVILLVATGVVTISLMGNGYGDGRADNPSFAVVVRDAMFQVVSIQTTTGFCTVDFDQWGFAAKATLLALMFVGASAGSTGGGIKVVRILIAGKVLLAELEHAYRPRVVRAVKIGRAVIDADLKLTVVVYVLGIALAFALGTILLMMLDADAGIDITSAATAAAATLNNIGPGLASVGATHHYAWLSGPSKLVLSVLMLLGRLEMFAVVALCSPRFWREE